MTQARLPHGITLEYEDHGPSDGPVVMPEASSAAARLLGISNSKKFQAAAASAIEELQEDGKLEVRDDKVFIV